jgi:hypothetical protein
MHSIGCSTLLNEVQLKAKLWWLPTGLPDKRKVAGTSIATILRSQHKLSGTLICRDLLDDGTVYQQHEIVRLI